LYLARTKKDQGWDHFHQLENPTFQQGQQDDDFFVWDIKTYFYDLDFFFHPQEPQEYDHASIYD
jgi:hypothetical protein